MKVAAQPPGAVGPRRFLEAPQFNSGGPPMQLRKENPILSIVNGLIIDLPSPSNISYMWNFGSLLGACLVIQILTGIFLSMHYCADVSLAFASVGHIMRDVNYGFLLRYLHANGASMFFLCVYLHIGRGLYFGSYSRAAV